MAQNTSNRYSPAYRRTTRRPHHAVSQCTVKQIEAALLRLSNFFGGGSMSASASCQLIGSWRIVEADIWERGYLDLCGPAVVTIGADNHGEISFGALQAGLDLSYGPSMVFFTWTGYDEMDEVTGEGHAELLDDGSIEITFAYNNGDEAILKARRDRSSTAR